MLTAAGLAAVDRDHIAARPEGRREAWIERDVPILGDVIPRPEDALAVDQHFHVLVVEDTQEERVILADRGQVNRGAEPDFGRIPTGPNPDGGRPLGAEAAGTALPGGIVEVGIGPLRARGLGGVNPVGRPVLRLW